MKRECETCIKRKTTYCPTSMECMATDDMPYYQNRIMLLEENKILKENAENNDKVVDKVNFENMMLKRENKRLKDNWNKLKERLINQIPTDKTLLTKYIKIFEVLDIMQELEQGKKNERL